MMRSEWNHPETTPEQWEVIETVYTWHRSIRDVDGKKQMEVLYKLGGFPLIKSLYADGCLARDLDSDLRRLSQEYTERLAGIQDQIAHLQENIMTDAQNYRTAKANIERAIKDLEEGTL